LTVNTDLCDFAAAESMMRVTSEIVFPNNIKELRVRKRLTQVQLGRLLDPPVGESTISKMESGERRLTNLQLANIATVLDCRPEEIPVVPNRDPATGVQRWQRAQQDAVRNSIESGAAATGYVLAQLRKKSGKTMQEVANAIGMTLSVYHRVEMASRIIQAGEIEAAAKLYGLTTPKLMGMFERRTRENLQQLKKGVPAEQLLPRTPRVLLKEDAKWGRLGALERYALQRSIRYVGANPKSRVLPVFGKVADDKRGMRRFVIDRDVMVDQIPVDALFAADAGSFFVRNFSQRLGVLMKPGSLAHVDPQTPVAMGDIAFLLRCDGSADAAVVIGDGLGPLKLKMYNPEEEIPIDDQSVAAVLRIGMLILP
jgi:transcriptional regulator with XRE-family HTH domain